jgi:hypothetical protein
MQQVCGMSSPVSRHLGLNLRLLENLVDLVDCIFLNIKDPSREIRKITLENEMFTPAIAFVKPQIDFDELTNPHSQLLDIV